MNLNSIPEWLATALLAAALATLGFVGKQIIEWITAVKSARRTRRAKLVTLLSLLNGTAAVFRVQATLRNRLLEMLKRIDPNIVNDKSGYDAVFARVYPQMNDEERQLHTVIRGYTINGLKPLNEDILKWLQADTEFKVARSINSHEVVLAHQLAALEAHLLMWVAKFAVWIPNAPAHSLVYLGDEEKHGVPFPGGIEATIQKELNISATSP